MVSEASAARPSRAPLDPVTILAAIGGVVASGPFVSDS